MSTGYVYVLSNSAFPGLIKIGFSSKEPARRAGELFTTGVPTPFQVEYFCVVENYSTVEALVHSRLSKFRNRQDREFFRLSVQAAARAIEQACSPHRVWSRRTGDQESNNNGSPFPPGHPLRDFYQDCGWNMDRSFLPGDRVRILADYEDIPRNTEAKVVEPLFNEMVMVRLSDGRTMEVRASDLRRTDQ